MAEGRRLRHLLAHRPLIAGTISVAALSAFGRFNGAIREVLIARDFGTSRSLEAFLVGFGIVSLIVVAFGTALPAAFIPTAFRGAASESLPPGRTRDLAVAVLPRLVALLAGGAVVVAVGSPILAAVGGGGFDPVARSQLTRVILLLAPVVLVAGLASLLESVLNLHQRFALGTVAPVVNPIVTVAVVVVMPASATALAVAFLSGYAAELGVAAVLVARSRLLERPAAAVADPAAVAGPAAAEPDVADPAPAVAPATARRGFAADTRPDAAVFFALLIPTAIAFGVQASNTVIDQAVTSHLQRGDVAVLAFGSRVPGFIAAVGITAVGTVVLPQFSRLAAGGHVDELRRSLRTKLTMLVALSTALAILLAVLSEPLLSIVFGRGEFTAADVTAAAHVQVFAAWQIPLHLATIVYLQLLAAHHRSRVILMIGLGTAVVNLVLDLALAAPLGVRGIALSSTITLALRCGVHGVLAHRSLSTRGGAGRGGPDVGDPGVAVAVR